MNKNDIDYVNSVIATADSLNPFASIFYLWAFIVLGGYLCMDQFPQFTYDYWIYVSALGFVLSSMLGINAMRRTGQVESRKGSAYALHFGVLLIFVLAGLLTEQGSAMLLIIGLGYAYAGVNFERNLLGVSAVMLILHLAVSMGWLQSTLITGAILAGSLFWVGWRLSHPLPTAKT